jgi:hypothetical protein
MTEITQYEINERKLVQLEITSKIDELLESGSMSVVSGTIGLNLIKTFIKYMDED